MGDGPECWVEWSHGAVLMRCDGCDGQSRMTLPNQTQFVILYVHQFAMKHAKCLQQASKGAIDAR